MLETAYLIGEHYDQIPPDTLRKQMIVWEPLKPGDLFYSLYC
jgi:hypothetical protein